MNDDKKSMALARNLAENLRHARARRGQSQQQLARLSGVPRSTLASIESGSSNPTLMVMARLADALQLSMEELLTPPRAAAQLFPRGELPIKSRGPRAGVTVSKLLPDPVPGMEIDRLLLASQSQMRGTPHQPGTREYLYCERGRITLWVEGERFDLAAGDVAAFPGDCRHSYRGAGETEAVGFSVVALAPRFARRAAAQ